MNRVALVGAGCGAGMLTLRGAELLRRCDCVVYDSLIDPALLGMVRADCEAIFVGKRAGAHSMSQEQICDLLVACAARYPLTVRLKGGDPFVFGRGGEELAALAAAGVRCFSVPGVTSAVAAAELSNIPVTHRGAAQSFRVCTAHGQDGGVPVPALRGGETLVVLMSGSRAGEVAASLMAQGAPAETPAALVAAAGTPDARTVRCTLAEVSARAADLPTPLTLLAGQTCAPGLLGDGALFARPPVLVTGTPKHVGQVSAALDARGFAPVPVPYLRPVPLDLGGFFAQMTDFDLLVFTSPNGAELFFGAARARGVDWRAFAGKRFAVLGASTAAALRAQGFAPDILPAEHTVAGLAAALRGENAARTALLRAENGSPALNGAGRQFSVYRTETDAALLGEAARRLSQVRYVTFGSAGGARALLGAAALPKEVRAVCIGEETARELILRGRTAAVADAHTADALAAAVEREEFSCNG